VVQGGLVGLHDQQVGGVLGGDQPVGVLALGVERVGGDHGVGEVQLVEQRPEPGDLVGRVVDVGLDEDRVGGVVHRGEQVDRRAGVVAAAAQGLAVDRDRPPPRVGRWRWRAGRWGRLTGQPGADGAVKGVRVDAGQHAAHGRLARWPPGAGQGVAAHPERGQHLAGRVAGPLADRGQGSGAGQHRGGRDGQHGGQCMPSAAALSWVGELGELAEQVAVLVGRQRGGRVQPMGKSRNGG
jgi:hypothetical protein